MSPHDNKQYKKLLEKSLAQQQVLAETIKQKTAEVIHIKNELKLAQTTAKIGNWEWDILKNTLIWSDEIHRLYGIPRTKFTPSYEGFINNVHPDDQAFVNEIITKSLKTKKPFSFSHRLIQPSGKIVVLKSAGKIKTDRQGTVVKMLGIAQDITKEYNYQKALETRTKELEEAYITQSRMALIVKSSQDAIITKNLNGIITSWNKSAESIFGYKSHEAIGKHISIIIPKDHLKEEYFIIKEIRNGRSVKHFDTIRQHKNGRIIPISVTISPLKDSTGKIIGASKIARDISERKNLEKQKEDFVGLVSHELKTPVTSLKMFTHIMSQHLKKSNDTKGGEYIKRIDEQLDRLTKLVIDLLDVTRIRKGKVEYHKTSFFIDELIEDIVRDLKPATRTHTISVNGWTSQKVFADVDRIRQVLINLITNAIKYSPGADKVDISFKKKDTNIVVSVHDYGIGITKSEQKKIFNRFYQVSAPELKTYPGLGLGLYICTEIIANNGGRLWVKSIQNKGSTFYFSLPIKK